MMILQELNLISFGKFERKVIYLQEGLNIIYGGNESGKTTIHNFIDGMFYGFLKPYVKRRIYLEELEKYKPWNREEYVGVIKFNKNDRAYRIQRDFNKGEVIVYDDITGKDITDHIDNGERIKVHLPGIYFFGFNNLVYRNTISIKQLGNQVDSNLAKEVKDRLANISTSLDDDISVKNAIEYLEKQLDQIGTKKAYTKPYGKAIKDLEKLKDERKYLLIRQEEYQDCLDKFSTLEKEIKAKREEINQLKELLKKTKLLNVKRNYEEALKIKAELESIDKKIDELKPYSQLSIDDYSKVLKLETNIEHVSEEIRNLNKDLTHLEEEINALELEDKGEVIEGVVPDELYEDVELFDELEEKKNFLVLNNDQNRLDNLNTQINGKIERKNRIKTANILFIIFTLGSLGLGFVNAVLFFLALPLFGGILYTRSLKKKLNEEIDELERQLNDLSKREEDRKKEIHNIEKEQQIILSKYDCESKSQLNRLKDNIYFKYMNQTNRLDKKHRLIKSREDILEKINNKTMNIQTWVKERDEILIKNDVKTIDEFNKGLENKNLYDTLIIDRENKINILDKILGDFNLDELKSSIEGYDDDYFKDIKEIDIEDISQEILEMEEILSQKINEKARLEERIVSLNQYVKQLMIIEEEIVRINGLIKEYENKIESIEIAKDTIESISQEIHKQFAPTINKKVSSIMDFITNGKYDQVRINDDLNIAVENPMTKEIINIDSLSGGTIDQLYFALRFSVSSSMEDGHFPLILDDCFIQYDNDRLKNILLYLKDVSNEKQILLFTCQNREKEILDELDIDYNLIELS